jgi:hypothetical protein
MFLRVVSACWGSGLPGARTGRSWAKPKVVMKSVKIRKMRTNEDEGCNEMIFGKKFTILHKVIANTLNIAPRYEES